VGFRYYSARKTGGDCRPFISSVEANAASMPVSYEHLKMLADDGSKSAHRALRGEGSAGLRRVRPTRPHAAGSQRTL